MGILFGGLFFSRSRPTEVDARTGSAVSPTWKDLRLVSRGHVHRPFGQMHPLGCVFYLHAQKCRCVEHVFLKAELLQWCSNGPHTEKCNVERSLPDVFVQ